MRQIKSNHFPPGRVPGGKYCSGCKCGICLPTADKLCAQQTAKNWRKRPKAFFDKLQKHRPRTVLFVFGWWSGRTQKRRQGLPELLPLEGPGIGSAMDLCWSAEEGQIRSTAPAIRILGGPAGSSGAVDHDGAPDLDIQITGTSQIVTEAIGGHGRRWPAPRRGQHRRGIPCSCRCGRRIGRKCGNLPWWGRSPK